MKERGFVNGNSMRRNGSRGMINGLTNGNGKKDGLINGNSNNNGNGKKGKKGAMSSPKGRAGAWTVIGIVLLLIFGVFAISTNTLKTTDWNVIQKYRDYDANTISNDHINIDKFAFHQARGAFEFYLQFEDNFLKCGDYKNLAYIFIDNDSNPSTGYDTGYIGADYVIKIVGYNDTVRGSFMKFTSGDENDAQHEWNWTTLSTAAVHSGKDNVITGGVNHIISSNAKIMVIAQSGYTQDITPVVSIEKSALLVIQTPLDNHTLEVELVPMYSAVKVNYLTVSFSAGVQIKELNKDKLYVNDTISVKKTYYLHVDTANVESGGIDVGISKVSTDSVYTIWGRDYREYIGTPQSIQIDGYFQDWNTIVGENNFNYNHHKAPNPNIDLYQFSEYNDTHGVYFYASVKGDMLHGNIAPEMENATGWSGATPAPQKSRSPYDYAEVVFYTKDNIKHVVQVYGFNGHVMRILMDGKPTKDVKVGVGRNGEFGAIEIGVVGNYHIIKYSVTMTDWNGATDTGSATPTVSNFVPYAPEFSQGAIAILVVLVAIPILRKRKKD